MKHIELRRLAAFADGALSAPEAAEVEAHLAECDGCRRQAEACRRVSAAVRRARELDFRRVNLESFAADVSRRARQRQKHLPAWWQRLRVTWGVEWGVFQRTVTVTCVLALLLGVGLVWQTRGTPPPADLPAACRIEYIEPGVGANVTVIADSDATVVLVSTGDTG
jgi:anti-sigma factor RsiW